MRLLKYILIFIIAAACIFRLWQERPSYETISGRTMGTYYGIKIKNSPAAADLAAEIEKTLTEVNAEMSVFDPDSELSKINAAPAGQWLELSEPMRKVMKKAHEIYRLSGGAFDPTVGRLIDLWGFGVKKGKKRPDDKEIRALLATSGFDKIRFDKDWQKLKKDNSEVTLNLSAIAKGYGVDRVAEKLEELGIRDYVVEIGGEVRAAGRKSGRRRRLERRHRQTGRTLYRKRLRPHRQKPRRRHFRRLSQLLLRRRQEIFPHHLAPNRLSG